MKRLAVNSFISSAVRSLWAVNRLSLEVPVASAAPLNTAPLAAGTADPLKLNPAAELDLFSVAGGAKEKEVADGAGLPKPGAG